jgi:ubiquinone/menaquinone biosynthesis C-methylase UbiE
MEFKLLNKPIHISLNGFNVSRRLEYHTLMRFLELKGKERLLDVACGDGFWTMRMAQFAGEVVGFDFNRTRLLQAKALSNGAIGGLIGCDAHRLPFRQSSFDAAVGICVLEHFHDDLLALQELRRVLKPGGRLALTVDSFSLPDITDAERARHAKNFSVEHWYRIETLQPLLEKAGFKVKHWHYMLKSPAAVAAYRGALKSNKLGYLLFPIAYPISVLGEALSKNNQCGYKLAISATAV